MADADAPPEYATQGHALTVDIEYVDALPGGKAVMLLAGKTTGRCLAVRHLFTPQVRDQVAHDIDGLTRLGLWPAE